MGQLRSPRKEKLLSQLKGGLIVSCQAVEGSPLYGSRFMAAMAQAAERGGAVGIRANGPQDIRAIKEVCSLPVIGIYKRRHPDSEIYITPDFPSAEAVVQAGAEIVALDATPRRRPGGVTLEELVKEIRARFDVLVMADISTEEEGVAAVAAGADIVATTLSGYTPYTASQKQEGPDLELVRRLVVRLEVPVIAEGRFWTPEEVCEAIRLGAHAVVVGTAITNPEAITARLVKRMKGCDHG
ncbi:N-acetylmannosamine-6-phosphate 2-epimerase [Candidatus Bipolaricaulota bacterium]|nr:N-acetylmannosamine-6-phosphate 2-epimerase [Candidatus Bipolaricaulota bacterium]